MEFSEIICKLLESRNVTAYKLSKETGISQRLIGYWKKGVNTPSSQNLQKLADYFNVSVDYLLSGEEAPQPKPSESNEVQLRQKLSHYGFALQALNQKTHDLTEGEMQDVSDFIDFLKAKRLLKDKEHPMGENRDEKS